jgi:uncharacterized repeat protein (TIGR01451 family)
MKALHQNFILPAVSLLLLAAAGTAAAQQHPILLKSIAESEITVKNAQGEPVKKRVPLSKALPGAEVIYTTTFTNQGSKAAGDIVVNDPIPKDTTYVGGSAYGDKTTITFSVDGGKSYAAPEKLIVTTADGHERPARPNEYTHIRWVYQGQLPPGSTGSAGFRVVVN